MNEYDENMGLKLTEAKLSNYMDRIIGQKNTKYEFMKWLKIDQK
jgi:hypothetical protein